MKLLLFFLTLFVFAGMCNNSNAICVYNREANTIWVYDYTKHAPCRPRQLLFADQMNEWGLVSYDTDRDAYLVDANLWIGRNNGTDTYFQLGTPARPHETLIVKGNLVIYPTVIPGEDGGNAKRGVHRLTIGCRDDPEVGARLLFLNAVGRTHTLLAGAYYQGQRISGVRNSGQLHVYNGLISAADRQYPIGRNLYMYLESVVLSNAVISAVAGTIGFGLNARNSLIDNTVFEDSGIAFAWGAQNMRGVTFRRLDTAFTDNPRYPLAVTLTECRFEDNDANWALSAGSLYLVDCEISPPRKGNRYISRKGATFGDHQKISTEEKTDSIRAISSRHVIFKVLDNHNLPVHNAKVVARCEQDKRIRYVAMTGDNGQTPRRGEDGALLLDEWEESAGEAENQPIRCDFSYTIEVTPPKGAVIQKIIGFKPRQSWDCIDLFL